MPDNEFNDWFDTHDAELLVMECEDIARIAFFAGMKAAQPMRAVDEKAVAWLNESTGAISIQAGGGYDVPLFRR